MLTDEGDTVVDIFGGSCTTGEVCEKLKRNWMCFEIDRDYVAASAFRFAPKDDLKDREIYDIISSGGCVDLVLDDASVSYDTVPLHDGNIRIEPDFKLVEYN